MQKEPKDPHQVFGFFPDKQTAQLEFENLRKNFPSLPQEFSEEIVKDEDWKNAYKKYIQAWSDRQLHWIPLWERENTKLPKNSSVVYLDAGMAFGTGAHETLSLIHI